MEKLANICISELEDRVRNEETYELIYMNYDNSNGIKICKNFNELSYQEKMNFYKMVIFNENLMITVYKFSEDEYRYDLIEKKDFNKVTETKEYYIKEKGNKEKKLQVKYGETLEGTKIFQFINFKESEE